MIKFQKSRKIDTFNYFKVYYNKIVRYFYLGGHMEERWNSIPEFQGFEASDQGRIRKSEYVSTYKDGSTKVCPAKVLSNHLNSGTVVTNLLGSTYHTHRLVASAFLGDISRKHIRFIDGDRTNVKLSNLKCCTPSESVKYDIQKGIRVNPPVYRGVKVVCNETGFVYRSIKNLSENLNLPRSTVRRYIHQHKQINGFTYSIYTGGGESDAE